MARKTRDNIILTLDTETIGLGGEIKRIAVYDGINVHYGYTFADVEPVLEMYYKDGYNVHCYIHNLEFDARKMPEIFSEKNILWSQCKIINGRFVKIACRKYCFHDSFRLVPQSLASLSKAFDLKHGKLDLWDEVQNKYPGEYKDHVDFLIRCDKDDPLYLKYLGYDVISLYELIYKLMDLTGICIDDFTKLLTEASLSRYIFRNGYHGKEFRQEGYKRTDFELLTGCKAWSSKKEVKGNHADEFISYEDVENIIRASYCGGRTEVFKPVLNHGFHYDVNSLYPSVMGMEFEKSGVSVGLHYPVGYPEYFKGSFQSKFQFDTWRRFHKGLGFLTAVIEIPFQHVPPLPVKRQKLMFPCGIVSGTWTFTELEYGIINCGVKIIEYKAVVYFSRTEKIFEDFISTFYQLKKKATEEGNRALREISKKIMNVGYGYTGMRRDDKTELQPDSKKEKYAENGRLLYHNHDLGYIEIQSLVHADYIQCQVASYVCSYARIILLDALRMQSESGEVFYCDTDSIVCSEPLPDDMVSDTELGKWDLEKVIDKIGIFLQPKVYYEDTKQGQTKKFKGVTRGTVDTFDEGFYKLILEKLKSGSTEKMVVEENRELLRSIKYAMKTGTDPNRLENRDKKLNLKNKQKRQMFYDANRTEPYYFKTLEEFETFNFDIDYRPYLNADGYLLNSTEGAEEK